MSIFVDHVAVADDILLQWYNIDEECGIMCPNYRAPMEIANEGDYYTLNTAWRYWIHDRADKINMRYFRNNVVCIKRLYKKTYVNKFMKEVTNGNIRVKSFHGVVYYNYRDILNFNMIYEIMTVYNFCKKHKVQVHWNGPFE